MIKNILLVNSILFSACLAISAQVELDFTQHTLFTKRTASWCTRCGEYGWDMFEGVLEDTEGSETIIPLAVHYSGDYTRPAGQAFRDYIGGSGQPLFFIDDEEIGVLRTNVAAKRAEVIDSLNAQSMRLADAGLSVRAKLVDQQIVVDISYSFSDAVNQPHMGVYLILDHYIAPQASQGSMADHKRMIWEALSEPYGDPLDPAVGLIADKSYTYDLGDLDVNHDVEDMQIAVVVWSGDQNDFSFVNGDLKPVNTSVDVQALDLDKSAKIYHSANEVRIELEQPLDDSYTVSAYSVIGQLVDQQRVYNAHSQLSTLDWRPGIYIVQLRGDDWSVSRRVLVR